MQTLQQLKSGLLGPVKKLTLSENLNEFPTEIFTVADSLEVLDLSNNQLSTLPDDFDRLKQLKILFVSNNNFEHLPAVLAKCPKLEMLGFKANKIRTVPENALPVDTRWLILTDNEIEKLPDSMGQLWRLQKLALAGNKITALPDSMQNCKNLQLARLSANQLTSLPDWLLQLPKLSWLAFSGNPLCTGLSQETKDMHKVQLADIILAEQLGEGASGVIYRGQWNNRPAVLAGGASDIALKLFKGAVTSDGYPIDELNCCLTAGQHPNLIKVLAQIAQQDQLGLVMELIPNTFGNLGLPPSLITCTRDTFAEGTQFDADAVARVALQMADTLEHLHAKGISHGDIYAHNVMVDSNYSLLFGDFGASSNLATLPVIHKEAMESIEIRAFGCLLEDMLSQCQQDDNCELSTQLTTLKDDCKHSEQAFRPRFLEIKAQLLLLSAKVEVVI
ncbi:leucine-rich repeat-containing protein kinase family protein [Psychromonas ossibalaenae]|uniref:leucine-rich repeat-containing protein kinase family protein n=1 Tax=Psychromonas ossibalaenae TaxID=444922 RepID=UPI0003665A1B|nr:leucine-rich repeat-containing protein kinase family protein [Psychromonas ossibalaenae]